MEAILHTIAVKRWRILLPVLMTALSVYLMLLAKEQQPLLWKMGTGWEVPARVLNSSAMARLFLRWVDSGPNTTCPKRTSQLRRRSAVGNCALLVSYWAVD